MDHREIGQKLKLFMFHPYSPGCPIWLPHGDIVYSILSNKIREFNKRNGYVEVRTPVIWKKELFEQSGHWDHFVQQVSIGSLLRAPIKGPPPPDSDTRTGTVYLFGVDRPGQLARITETLREFSVRLSALLAPGTGYLTGSHRAEP